MWWLRINGQIIMEIRTIEICGIASVLSALHLPYGKNNKSETLVDGSISLERVYVKTSITIDPRDINLLSKLVKNGDEHAKVVRGMIVYLEINAPRYWWVEMDTYRVGTERLSSESTMHIQGKGLTTEELVKMKSELKEGTMQKRVQMFSYQALRRIYFQRVNHRLPEWKEFCKYIESLPFFEQLIAVK